MCRDSKYNINFDDKISNYETGGVIIKVTEKNIIVDSPTGSGPQTLLRVQNHGKAGLGYENNYCSIYIPNSEAPKNNWYAIMIASCL